MLNRSFYSIQAILLLVCLTSCSEKQPENTPPVAYFTVGENTGTVETLFTFDASGSYDNEDDASELEIRWDWQDDGVWDTEYSTRKIVKKGFGRVGFYKVRLEVMDTEGLKSDYSEIISIEDYLLIDLRDQKHYTTVRIGSQLWMSENLDYDTYAGSYCHGNDTENCKKYGRLYEWTDAGIACPDGWKLPGIEDWQLLIDYLGENAGHKMKSRNGWQAEQNGDNSSGFNALPASYLTQYGEFMALGSYAFFWTSSPYDDNMAWIMLLSYNSAIVTKNYYNKRNAFSVRCIKN